MYGLSAGDFCLVDDLTQADIAVLPMTWNHYLKRRELPRALDFIRAARRIGRPILSYVSGDEGVTVPPEFDDVYVVRASGFRSRRRKRQIAQPVFFDDPLKRYPDLESYDRPTKGEARPSVGFCGQVSVNVFKLFMDVFRSILRNGAFRLGLRQAEPQPLYPPALIRGRALRILGRSQLVKTQFVIRSRYRAGAVGIDSRQRTSREFYENIAGTDYTLCVRGGGNFSKRFYETLAMGRIPVLVDTDCLLPFEEELPWDQAAVRISSRQLGLLPRRVADHFRTMGLTGLAELKKANRKLWVEELSFDGFHRKVVRKLVTGAAP